jgi:hypothetical protein
MIGKHTISHGRRDGQCTLLADAHADETFVPTTDDLANADYTY